VNDLCLEQPDDGFGQRVAITVADADNGEFDPGFGQGFFRNEACVSRMGEPQRVLGLKRDLPVFQTVGNGFVRL